MGIVARFPLHQIGDDLSAMVGGDFVNRFTIDGRSYKVIPQIKRSERLTPDQLKDIYVTGTSGKTSVAAFTRQIWQRLGHESASIGTIGLVSPKRTAYGSLTTPDPIALHKQLDEITGDGVTHLAFEASSHGLDQFRLDGVRIAAGALASSQRRVHGSLAPNLRRSSVRGRATIFPSASRTIASAWDITLASWVEKMKVVPSR